ncbi:CUB and sushi domain-containing 3 [Olea europaea subsp. europaea]|uniref:CUB and sushi domain-containing 3 n=1 Tax=Olea europaea subsp. europaea TaxID=158383 RepID=A0A8S0S148_OLEEU|nr:CUB and sushi domain-containing 3 [Olea europaea subsp. europaea]
MGLRKAGALLILVAISMFGIGMANKNFSADWNGNWYHTTGWPYGHWKADQTSKRIIVGGSENWRFGFNYTDWAIKNGPFYLNDTLVFKFDPPNDTTFPHSVYLLPNLWSFQNCDLRRAQKIAHVTQGAGEGEEPEPNGIPKLKSSGDEVTRGESRSAEAAEPVASRDGR